MVSYNSSSYVALQANNAASTPDVDATNWALFAAQGAAGPTGPQGVQGLKGDTGDAGATGPQGPQGVQGLKGDTGDTGATGPQGPQGPQGVQGLKGDTGDAGLSFIDRGNFVLNNSYAGNDVVSYNSSSYVALQANNAASTPDVDATNWALFAAQGAAGPTGPQGVQGLKGDTGDAGATGPQGPQGVQGLKGDTGDAGLSFIDRGNFVLNSSYAGNDVVSYNGASYVALQANNAASTPDVDTTNWALFAAQGPAGPAGPQGVQGLKGDTGDAGATGPQGPQGVQGEVGPQGPIGLTGATGPQGPTGVNGKTVISGHGAPDAGVGADGDVYVDLNGGFLYGPKANGAWDMGPNTTSTMYGNVAPLDTISGVYELGTKFRVNASGQITSIRFYKIPGDTTSPRVGNIWSLTGTLLASVTFASETASGWQVQDLPTPLTVTAGDIYTVSFNTTVSFGYTFNGLTMLPSDYPGSPLTVLNSRYALPGSFPTTDDGIVAFFADVVLSGPGAGLRGAAGPTGAIGATGPQGAQGPQGPQGANGPEGPQGPQGETGATGATGAAGVATFFSTASVSSGQCVGNIELGTSNHSACLAGVSGFSSDVTLLAGPVPASGGTVADLKAFTSGAPTGAQSYTVNVLDATPSTATVLLTCTVNSSTSSSCSSSSAVTVAAGHYLEVRITNNNSAPSVPWRISFRY